ncbi:MAG: LarC family nickel insertion protein [Candidatus Omnitrophica bacterium]|nr:LarC family nickel insertion protein [Candidatus Omnitrophota bacterium]
MRIAYFDCFSGISGDMTLGAFIDAGLSFKTLSDELAKLKIKGYRLKRSKTSRGGISGTSFKCIADGDAHSHSLKEIVSIIKKSSLDSRVKNTAVYIFENISAAEAKVHGIKTGDDVRLHELGSIDSIIDIVGTAIALSELGIDEVYASPVTTGRGWVMTAHGRLPVPAPAALEILRGIPIKMSGSRYELVTPTGAGILKTLSRAFGEPPEMTADRIGYGAGSRDHGEGLPNMLRIVVGEAAADFVKDSVYVIETKRILMI